MDLFGDAGLEQTQTWESTSSEETMALAEDCAKTWSIPQTVGLVGPLGSGKTTFVKGVIKALGVSDQAVRCPTFTIINGYEHPEFHVAHADLYRVESRQQQETIGLEDYFKQGLLLVEWADRWEGAWPDDAGFLRFEYSGEDRRLIKWRPSIPDQVEEIDKTVKGSS